MLDGHHTGSVKCAFELRRGPPHQILADQVVLRIDVVAQNAEARFDASDETGVVPIAAVENHRAVAVIERLDVKGLGLLGLIGFLWLLGFGLGHLARSHCYTCAPSPPLLLTPSRRLGHCAS